MSYVPSTTSFPKGKEGPANVVALLCDRLTIPQPKKASAPESAIKD